MALHSHNICGPGTSFYLRQTDLELCLIRRKREKEPQSPPCFSVRIPSLLLSLYLLRTEHRPPRLPTGIAPRQTPRFKNPLYTSLNAFFHVFRMPSLYLFVVRGTGPIYCASMTETGDARILLLLLLLLYYSCCSINLCRQPARKTQATVRFTCTHAWSPQATIARNRFGLLHLLPP